MIVQKMNLLFWITIELDNSEEKKLKISNVFKIYNRPLNKRAPESEWFEQ